MRIIDCPECAVMMQPFFAQGVTGLRVELDRCAKCGRIWFDVKELETAVGRSFLPRMRGAPAAHGCPVDEVLLDTSLIRGEVPIEECGRCGGALLDEHDFELISGGKLQETKPPPPPSKKPKLVEFTCERCRTRTPVSEAGNVKGATVCRACEGKPWPNQPGWYQRSSSTGTDAVSDLLDDLVDHLFNR